MKKLILILSILLVSSLNNLAFAEGGKKKKESLCTPAQEQRISEIAIRSNEIYKLLATTDQDLYNQLTDELVALGKENNKIQRACGKMYH